MVRSVRMHCIMIVAVNVSESDWADSDYLKDPAAAPVVKKVVDHAGAYWPDGNRSPAHQIWCSLLSLVTPPPIAYGTMFL